VVDPPSYIDSWLHEVALIAEAIDGHYIEEMVYVLNRINRRGGRLFVLGVGGSAANAAHAVNDFRRIARMEAYCPTSEVAELTALANDVGWHSIFAEWLKESHLNAADGILVLSVNGGTSEISPHLVAAVQYAIERNANIMAVVGRKEGFAARHADAWIAIPCPNDERRTPHSESFQLVVTHLLAWLMRDKMIDSVSRSPAGEPIE
jgi:D-sedoheptulose 7-phosphate isomerase